MGSKERFYVDIQSLNSNVTGSCHLCIVKYPDKSTSRFIVDCGLFQGLQEESEDYNKDFPFNEDSIEFALITHNHVDHVGRLPLLCKNGFNGKIYTTLSTSKLLPLALYDSCKVLKDVSKRKHQPNLYGESDVKKALSLIVGIPFDHSIMLSDNIKATFFCNGHLVGAAMILVQISFPGYDDINLLFTGDYNNKNLFFDVPSLPEEVLNLPLTIIQESTYGTMNSDEMQPCFEQNVLSALEKDATIIVPVFSLGRSQEILYLLKKMQDDGKISADVPIYFDGKLARRYTALYLTNQLGLKEDMIDFLPHAIQYVDCENRDLILNDIHSKIIVTTSGMGSYGPTQVYIPAFIKHENALIHFTGYTAEGTLGNRLKTTPVGEVVKVGGLLAKKQAQVEYTTEFSAHAKADEMIQFLKQFRNLNLVIVNHGESAVKDAFAKRILEEVNPKDVGIANREIFFRITPYHLDRTLTTKFQ